MRPGPFLSITSTTFFVNPDLMCWEERYICSEYMSDLVTYFLSRYQIFFKPLFFEKNIFTISAIRLARKQKKSIIIFKTLHIFQVCCWYCTWYLVFDDRFCTLLYISFIWAADAREVEGFSFPIWRSMDFKLLSLGVL